MTKREQIIEILESDYNIDNIENVGDIADVILALDEKKPRNKKVKTKIKICAACGSFAHGNPGHDISI